jgi:hypothetical protein
MKAQDFVLRIKEVFEDNRGPNDSEVMYHLFDMLICDMGKILATRVKVRESRLNSVVAFMEDVGENCISMYEKHLGSILQEINHKAMKVNKLGKYGYSENWFQSLFIKKVKEYVENHPKCVWRFYFPECKEIVGVTYPAFVSVKEFLNP